MILKNLCVFVLWMKVASALEGLSESEYYDILMSYMFKVDRIFVHFRCLGIFGILGIVRLMPVRHKFI